eukprot:GHVL01027124.1.p1 GENE.GHVL01027124.1~~GHVL01027124.1.p1  ORF type:complete len:472 (+),score=74.14 GHVL01027124.1:1593-3008(+)
MKLICFLFLCIITLSEQSTTPKITRPRSPPNVIKKPRPASNDRKSLRPASNVKRRLFPASNDEEVAEEEVAEEEIAEIKRLRLASNVEEVAEEEAEKIFDEASTRMETYSYWTRLDEALERTKNLYDKKPSDIVDKLKVQKKIIVQAWMTAYNVMKFSYLMTEQMIGLQDHFTQTKSWLKDTPDIREELKKRNLKYFTTTFNNPKFFDSSQQKAFNQDMGILQRHLNETPLKEGVHELYMIYKLIKISNEYLIKTRDMSKTLKLGLDLYTIGRRKMLEEDLEKGYGHECDKITRNEMENIKKLENASDMNNAFDLTKYLEIFAKDKSDLVESYHVDYDYVDDKGIWRRRRVDIKIVAYLALPLYFEDLFSNFPSHWRTAPAYPELKNNCFLKATLTKAELRTKVIDGDPKFVKEVGDSVLNILRKCLEWNDDKSTEFEKVFIEDKKRSEGDETRSKKPAFISRFLTYTLIR